MAGAGRLSIGVRTGSFAPVLTIGSAYGRSAAPPIPAVKISRMDRPQQAFAGCCNDLDQVISWIIVLIVLLVPAASGVLRDRWGRGTPVQLLFSYRFSCWRRHCLFGERVW